MIHLNGNILCAVNIETTGTKVGLHDITQVCVMPLDSTIKPHPTLMPFDLVLRPDRLNQIDIEDVKINKLRLGNYALTGFDPFEAADLFAEWYKSLQLRETKKIMPLAYNWASIRPFIEEWLGPLNFEYHFDDRYRDVVSIALYLDDRADVEVEQFPFAKVDLRYIASSLKLPFEPNRNNESIYNCAVIAAIYHELLRLRVGIL